LQALEFEELAFFFDFFAELVELLFFFVLFVSCRMRDKERLKSDFSTDRAEWRDLKEGEEEAGTYGLLLDLPYPRLVGQEHGVPRLFPASPPFPSTTLPQRHQ
jgi:hypothetical protein